VGSVIIFDNGNIAVFDQRGQQIPELQEGWINWNYLKRLGWVIAHDKPRVDGAIPLPGNLLGTYVELYTKYPDMEQPGRDVAE
jgi:hypothetical protein